MIGSVGVKMKEIKEINFKYPYSLSLDVPEWCRLPPNEHNDNMGGCWGISHGFVEKLGKDYCRTCEYNKDKVGSETSPT